MRSRNGKRSAFYFDTTIEKDTLARARRPIREPSGAAAGAVQSVYPLGPTQTRRSRRIRFWILLIGGIGIALAAALAALVATAALRPVRRLTAAAETRRRDRQPDRARRGRRGNDELGRLAARFNAMLAALEESVGRQRRLVADASHELRTPLTAARTNIDLVREGRLPEEEAQHALDEASVELDALTTLVSDWSSSRAARSASCGSRTCSSTISSPACRRAREGAGAGGDVRHRPLADGRAASTRCSLERAVSNLLDNAVKYSPAGAPIEVTVRDGEVVVADHGPGIAERTQRGSSTASTAPRQPARSRAGSASRSSARRPSARRQGDGRELGSGARFRLSLPAAV